MSSRNAAPDDAKTVARETTRYVKGNRFSTKKYERSIFYVKKWYTKTEPVMQTFFEFHHAFLAHVEEDCVQPRPQGALPWLQNWPPKPGKIAL